MQWCAHAGLAVCVLESAAPRPTVTGAQGVLEQPAAVKFPVQQHQAATTNRCCTVAVCSHSTGKREIACCKVYQELSWETVGRHHSGQAEAEVGLGSFMCRWPLTWRKSKMACKSVMAAGFSHAQTTC